MKSTGAAAARSASNLVHPGREGVVRHARDGMAVLAARRGLAFVRDEAFGKGRRGVGLVTLPGQGDDAGAACILTGNAGLAARLRNILAAAGFGADALPPPAGPAITGAAVARMCRVLHRGRGWEGAALAAAPARVTGSAA